MGSGRSGGAGMSMQFPFQAKEVTPIPPPGQMCEDCAFRPDSQERDPNYKGMSLAKVKELTESFQANGVPTPFPFTCHAGMEPDGKGSYVKYPDPKDPRWRVCAGWDAIYGAKNRALDK